MQLCFSTLACPGWSIAQMVSAAGAHGIEGIDFRGIGEEIDITRSSHFQAELKHTLALFGQHALAMPCLNTSVTLVSPAADRWQMMLEECHRYAMLAPQTHSRYLRIFGGAVPKGMTPAEALTMARRHLRQVVHICAAQSCLPLLETHDDWATAPAMLAMLEGFEPRQVGVLWDLEHPYRRGERPVDTATALRPFVRHVHVKDSVRRDGKNIPRLLGEGDLPLEEMFQALRGIGYDDWICLETEKRWHADAPDPEQSIPQFVQYMKGRWPRGKSQ